jgi:hypothetical protein
MTLCHGSLHEGSSSHVAADAASWTGAAAGADGVDVAGKAPGPQSWGCRTIGRLTANSTAWLVAHCSTQPEEGSLAFYVSDYLRTPHRVIMLHSLTYNTNHVKQRSHTAMDIFATAQFLWNMV